MPTPDPTAADQRAQAALRSRGGARAAGVLPRSDSLGTRGVPEQSGSLGTGGRARHTAQDGATSSAPPAMDALFGALWPERDGRGRPRLVGLALGIAALAAVILPYRRNGIGTTLVLLVAAAAILVAAPKRTAWTYACLVIGTGLALIPMLRAATWLIPLVLLCGAVVLVVAVTPARSVLALIAESIAWPLAGLRGLPWLGRSLRTRGDRRIWWSVARTIVVSGVASGVFLALFASADAVLRAWMDSLLPNLSMNGFVFRSFVFGAVFGVTLSGIYLALNPIPDDATTLPPRRPTRSRWEWLIPVGLVIAAYVLFIAAEATAWLGGHDYVHRTTGMTYAAYSHQGFGQLLVASMLTLLVVAIAARKSGSREAAEVRIRRLVLGTLCALTLVVVASALYRMHLYQQAYGYTTLRLLADLIEVWVGLVVVLVMVAGLTRDGRWLPRAAALSGAGMVLALGLLNPDAWIANRNIDRYEHVAGHRLDTVYLSTLSDDATEAIVTRLPTRLRDCALGSTRAHGRVDDPLEWNLGRHRAAEALAGVEVDPSGGHCQGPLGDS